MPQLTLTGKSTKKYSCCHCSWEGYAEDEEYFKGFNGKVGTCPVCGWAIWEVEKAKNLTGLYDAFRKKYGEKKWKNDTIDIIK